jgi:hypothetical protein
VVSEGMISLVCKLGILALERQRQEDFKFKDSLGCIERPYFKNKQTSKTKRKENETMTH